MESAFKKVKSSHNDSKENSAPKKTIQSNSIDEAKPEASIRPLQVLAEVSTNSLREIESKPMTSKQSNNQVPKSRDFCCLYRSNDKKFCVLSTSCIRVQNIDSICVGKIYDVLIGNSYVKGIVKYLGNNNDCFNQLRHLEAYFKSNQNQLQSIKRKIISTDSIKSIHDKPNETLESLRDKVKELERQLKEKDQIIEQQNEEIRIKRDLIEFYKDNYDSEAVRRIRSFCTNFIQVFGSEPIVDYNNNQNFDVYLSPNFMDLTVSVRCKNELDSIIRMSENGSIAFRQVIQKLIPDSFIWAKSSRKDMMENYNRVIRACWEYVNQMHPDLLFNGIPNIIGKISSVNRTKLQNKGYKIITTFDPNLRNPVYEIFKPNFDNHQNFTQEEVTEELNEEVFDEMIKNEKNDHEENIDQFADIEKSNNSENNYD